MTRSKVIGLIPSRYESTRFPGKPLALIAGKSLIRRTYESAKLCSRLSSLHVATDDSRIAEHVQSFGGSFIMTSKECKNGTERISQAFVKKSSDLNADIVVNIQGDHPTISPQMLDSLIDIMDLHPDCPVATLAYPSSNKEDFYSPHTVKCIFNSSMSALYFSRSPIPFTKNPPNFHHHIGIYAYRPDFLKKIPFLADTPLQLKEDLEQLKFLEHGYSIKIALVNEPTFGVDIPEDITQIEKILCKKNISLLQEE